MNQAIHLYEWWLVDDMRECPVWVWSAENDLMCHHLVFSWQPNTPHTFVYKLFLSTSQSTPLKPSAIPLGLQSQCKCMTWLKQGGYTDQRSCKNFPRWAVYLCFLQPWNIGTQSQRRSSIVPTWPMFMACASIQYHIPSHWNSIGFSSNRSLWSLLANWSKEDLTICWSHIASEKLSICSHVGLPLMKSLISEHPVILSQHTRISDSMRWWIPSFTIQYVGCSASFDKSFGCKTLNKSKTPPLMSLWALGWIWTRQIASTQAMRMWKAPGTVISHCRRSFSELSIARDSVVVSCCSSVPRSPWHNLTYDLYQLAGVLTCLSMFSMMLMLLSFEDAFRCIVHVGCWLVFVIGILSDDGIGPRCLVNLLLRCLSTRIFLMNHSSVEGTLLWTSL